MSLSLLSDYLVDNAVSALTGDSMLGDAASIALANISGLSDLLSRATPGAQQIYSQLTGSSLQGDVSKFFGGSLAGTSSAYEKDPTFVPCSTLPSDVQKALLAAHENLTTSVPNTCRDGVFSKCDDIFVNDRKNAIKTMQSDIDKLMCTLSQKQTQLQAEELALANCTKKLDDQNDTCSSGTCTKPSKSSCGCTKKKKATKKSSRKKRQRSDPDMYIPYDASWGDYY